jgi:hypothetical protein
MIKRQTSFDEVYFGAGTITHNERSEGTNDGAHPTSRRQSIAFTMKCKLNYVLDQSDKAATMWRSRHTICEISFRRNCKRLWIATASLCSKGRIRFPDLLV